MVNDTLHRKNIRSVFLYRAQFSCFIGNILQDRLLLFRPTSKEIYFEEISLVEYTKYRDYVLNLLLGGLGILLLFLIVLVERNFILLLSGLLFTLLSLVVKKERTIIKIILRKSSIIIIKLKKKEEKKGQIFVKKVKQYMC